MDVLPTLTTEIVIVMVIVVLAMFIFATELLRDISSRSANVSTSFERRLGAGRMPPHGAN